jgi:glutamate racemase
LGCTHFPVFRRELENLLDPDVQIVDSAATTAAVVAQEMAALGLLCEKRSGANNVYLATDGAARFAQVGSHFLGNEITDVELVDL